jgi:hemerythrin-like domain-containing protein
MKATEILKREHQAILLVITAAEKEVASIVKTGRIQAQTVREMADFFKNFVDRCHHAKEEKACTRSTTPGSRN